MKSAIIIAALLASLAFTASAAKKSNAAAGNQISDSELLALVRARYERDLASDNTANIAKWHGRVVLEEPDETNRTVKITFADGFSLDQKMKKRGPVKNAHNKLSASYKREKLEKEKKKLEDQIAVLKSGAPLKALETRIENIKKELEK